MFHLEIKEKIRNILLWKMSKLNPKKRVAVSQKGKIGERKPQSNGTEPHV